MQPNIAMKFAEYVVWIILCKNSKFGEYNFYDFRDIKFFARGVSFLWCALYKCSVISNI